jgi:hypothetical protein
MGSDYCYEVENSNPDKVKNKYKIRYTEDTGIGYGADWTHPSYVVYLEEQLSMADKRIKNLEQLIHVLREELREADRAPYR